MEVDNARDAGRAKRFFRVPRAGWPRAQKATFVVLFSSVLGVVLSLADSPLCFAVGARAPGTVHGAAPRQQTGVGTQDGGKSASLGHTGEGQDRDKAYTGRGPYLEVERPLEDAARRGGELVGQRHNAPTPSPGGALESAANLSLVALDEENGTDRGASAVTRWGEADGERDRPIISAGQVGGRGRRKPPSSSAQAGADEGADVTATAVWNEGKERITARSARRSGVAWIPDGRAVQEGGTTSTGRPSSGSGKRTEEVGAVHQRGGAQDEEVGPITEQQSWEAFDDDARPRSSLPSLDQDETPVGLDSVQALLWSDDEEQLERLSLDEGAERGNRQENSPVDTRPSRPSLEARREAKIDMPRKAGAVDQRVNIARRKGKERVFSLADKRSNAHTASERIRRTGLTKLLKKAQRLLISSVVAEVEPMGKKAGRADEWSNLPNSFRSPHEFVDEANLRLGYLINAVNEANRAHSRQPYVKANIPKPLMGWNSWNTFGCDTSQLNERLVKETAQALKASGLQAAGYEYVMLDDCWSIKKAQERGPTEPLRWDAERFPSGMPALASFLHYRGFKFGLYADSGSRTCMGYTGSRGHEDDDALAFQSWGVDFLKIDGCYADPSEMRTLYSRWSPAFAKAAAATPGHQQKVVLNCSWPAYVHDVTDFDFHAIQGMCDMWRVYDDIEPSWESLSRIMDFWGDNQDIFSSVVAPGSFNDPDMLEVGNPNFSPAEGRTQMSVWSILAAPLILGNDVRRMSPATLQILTNPEVLAVNQDDMIFGGLRVFESSDTLSIWMRPLSGGSTAVALVNLSPHPLRVVIDLRELQLVYWNSWLPWAQGQLLRLANRLPFRSGHWPLQRHFPPLDEDLTTGSVGCYVRDLWLRLDLGFVEHAIVSPYILDPHDTFMVTIHGCEPARRPYPLPAARERDSYVSAKARETGERDADVAGPRTNLPTVNWFAGEVARGHRSEASAYSETPWNGSVSAEEMSVRRAGPAEDETEGDGGSAGSSPSVDRPAALAASEM